MEFNMLFIELGNMAYNNPSIIKSRPIAIPKFFHTKRLLFDKT